MKYCTIIVGWFALQEACAVLSGTKTGVDIKQLESSLAHVKELIAVAEASAATFEIAKKHEQALRDKFQMNPNTEKLFAAANKTVEAARQKMKLDSRAAFKLAEITRNKFSIENQDISEKLKQLKGEAETKYNTAQGLLKAAEEAQVKMTKSGIEELKGRIIPHKQELSKAEVPPTPPVEWAKVLDGLDYIEDLVARARSSTKAFSAYIPGEDGKPAKITAPAPRGKAHSKATLLAIDSLKTTKEEAYSRAAMDAWAAADAAEKYFARGSILDEDKASFAKLLIEARELAAKYKQVTNFGNLRHQKETFSVYISEAAGVAAQVAHPGVPKPLWQKSDK